MNYVDDKSRYIRCQKKAYSVEARKPVKGTLIVNRYASLLTYSLYGDIITPEYYKVMIGNNDNMKLVIQGKIDEGAITPVDDEKPICVKDADGSLSLYSEDDFEKCYGKFHNEVDVAFETYHAAGAETISYAVQIPEAFRGTLRINDSYYDYNMPGVLHSSGDYVVAESDVDGNIDMNNRKVINGVLFDKTYDLL